MSESQDKAFEIFVKRAISSIQKEAWGRSREIKELREACGSFLALLEHHEGGSSYDGSLAIAVLLPLSMACNCNNTKIVEISLGCLHKLVAHAWLQGESSTYEGLLSDEKDVVTQVVKLVMKCGESANEVLQLSVVRALLTFTTAEHFIAHGDTLMSAVRTVFNLALGSEDENIKRTAANALLQMLNTIVKRVTTFHVHHHSPESSTQPSRRASDSHGQAPMHPGHPSDGRLDSLNEHHGKALETEYLDTSSDARIAQFATLAEMRDLRGLEAAIEEGAEHEGPAVSASLSTRLSSATQPPGELSERVNGEAGLLVQPKAHENNAADTSVSPLAPSNGALEAATTQDTPSMVEHAHPPDLHQQGAAGSVAHLSHPAPKARPLSLSVMERDVLLVLSAFCKLASREAGLTEVESYLHQGKLLSLELLVKVLQNPQHSWSNVRDDFCRALRQPLCITLLRNCAASDPSAFQLATKLLSAVLLQPKLRHGLKAEMGAFYPLFVLRPIEKERQDLLTLYTVLTSLRHLCTDPQLMVDLFTNYDCDLQAPNLYERTVTALGALVCMPDSDVERPQQVQKLQEHVARLAAIREAALRCISSVVQCLQAWAAPIREAHIMRSSPSAVEGGSDKDEQSEEFKEDSGGLAVTGGGTAVGSSGTAEKEAELFESTKAYKSSLSCGIDLFNTHPVKGVRFLLQAGVIAGGKTPASVAAFLAEHHADISKQALGEYFGHHEDFEIASMHAYVDLQRFSGVTIDMALRQLLYKFRLPGEAQKIDRIMEKFAERFVEDNPGMFGNADAAYMLSFAIIMLNTDAHNPLAERRLGKSDFVAMNSQPATVTAAAPVGAEGGTAGEDVGQQVDPSAPSETQCASFEPVLPLQELEAIYERIVSQEIVLVDEASARGSVNASSASRTQLAAALGLRLLAFPFLPLARNWGKGQRAEMTEAQRKREIMQMVEREVVRGAGGMWHTSSHAAHTRPMLSISGTCILDALSYGLSVTSDVTRVAALLSSTVAVTELACLLGLDQLCEACVASLVKVSGLAAPSAYRSSEEARQLAALKALFGLSHSPISTLPAPSWLLILRTASQLDALSNELCRFNLSETTLSQAGQNATSGSSVNGGSSQMGYPFSKMFQALGFSLGGSGGAPAAPQRALPASISSSALSQQMIMVQVGRASTDTGLPSFPKASTSEVMLRIAPGASMVVWAMTDGAAEIEQVYGQSAALDGDAVLVFMRSLCVVSSEEIEDAEHPNVYSLKRMVDCASANIGRIRLIWSRLWSIVSSHLVMASCHSDRSVALNAVDALRELVQRQLARGELAHFTHQEGALRPFASVLRHSDEAAVRKCAVAFAANACLHQGSVLGSGWHTLLDLLWRAADDSDEQVVEQSVTTLKAVVAALHQELAKENHLRDVVDTCKAIVHNAVSNDKSCLAAVEILEACAQHLPVHSTGAGEQVPPLRISPELLHAARQATRASSLKNATSEPEPGLHPEPPVDGWLFLLTCLNELSQDSRAAVASAASRALFEVMNNYGHSFSGSSWHLIMSSIMPHLLCISQVDTKQASAASGLAAGDLPSAAALQDSPAALEELHSMETYLHRFINQMDAVPPRYKADMLGCLASTSLEWMAHGSKPFADASMRGLEHLARCLAEQEESSHWSMLLGLINDALASELQVVMGLASSCRQLSEGARGMPKLHPSGGGAGSHMSRGSAPAEPQSHPSTAHNPRSGPLPAAGQQAASSSTIAAFEGPYRQLRLRSHTLLLMQRLLVHIHSLCSSPQVQTMIADILVKNVRALMQFNLNSDQDLWHSWGSGWQLWVESPSDASHSGLGKGTPMHQPFLGAPFVTPRQPHQLVDLDTISSITEASALAPQRNESGTDEDVADGILEAGSLSNALQRVSCPAPVAPPSEGGAAAVQAQMNAGDEPHAGALRQSESDASGASARERREFTHVSASSNRQPCVLLLSSDACDNPDLGLVRLELEAATAALAILKQLVIQEGGVKEQAGQEAAKKLLLDFCVFIIHANAANQNPHAATGLPSAPSGLHQGRVPNSNCWRLAAQNGVLMTAITTYTSVAHADSKLKSGDLTAVLLAQDFRKHQGVRLAVAQYFRHIVLN